MKIPTSMITTPISGNMRFFDWRSGDLRLAPTSRITNVKKRYT